MNATHIAKVPAPSRINMKTLQPHELVLLWYANPVSEYARGAAHEVMRRLSEGELRVVADEPEHRPERWRERWLKK